MTVPGPTAGQEGGSAAGPVTVVFQSHAEAVFFLVAKEGMKLVSEPLSMPLTAPFHYGKGTLSGFSFRESSRHAYHFTVHSCFMSSGGCPWWPVLGFGSKLFVSLPWPLAFRPFLRSVSLFLTLPAVLHYFFGSPLFHIFSQR